jgi:hypothetical protein
VIWLVIRVDDLPAGGISTQEVQAFQGASGDGAKRAFLSAGMRKRYGRNHSLDSAEKLAKQNLAERYLENSGCD